MKVLKNLNGREWADDAEEKLSSKLSEMELDNPPGNRKKYLGKKYAEFTAYLMKEFSLITTNYYTTQGMIFGMIFGQGIGLALGTAIAGTTGLALGISLGTGMGMAIGIALGAAKDAEAKKKGKVLG